MLKLSLVATIIVTADTAHLSDQMFALGTCAQGTRTTVTFIFISTISDMEEIIPNGNVVHPIRVIDSNYSGLQGRVGRVYFNCLKLPPLIGKTHTVNPYVSVDV